MTSRLKTIWQDNKGVLSSVLLSFMNKELTKAVLKKLAISGGFRGWLITFVLEELIEEVDERVLEPAFRKIGYTLEVHNGKKIYKKVIDATDIDDWSDAVNDI